MVASLALCDFPIANEVQLNGAGRNDQASSSGNNDNKARTIYNP